MLAERGFRTAVAGMTLPNRRARACTVPSASRQVGVYRRIGWKHGAWHDVAWVQRTLASTDDPPAEPR